MSQSSAATSSSRAEARHPVTIDEIITTVIMARVTEFFGFFVYAIASVLVFPTFFFPNFEPVTGALIAFAIFPLGFVVRPFASLLARQVERRLGRVPKVVIALFVFGGSTIGIGLLPGFDEIGYVAVSLLVILTIGQGIGQGMSWDGLTLKLQFSAPRGRKNLYAMVPQLGAPIGFAIAAAIYFVLTGFLTDEEFIEWGWRFPFFAALAVNVVSLFARVRLINSNFGDDMHLSSAPFGELLRRQWKPIVRSTFIPLPSYALFHLVTIFPLGFLLLYKDEPIANTLLLQMFGATLAIGSVILSGLIADRIGRRRLMTAMLVPIALFSLAVFTLESYTGWYLIIGFVIFGLSYGQTASINPGRFEREFQYSGSALATNLSWIFGASFAPLAALALTAAFGLWSVALYLLSGVVVSMFSLLAEARTKADRRG